MRRLASIGSVLGLVTLAVLLGLLLTILYPPPPLPTPNPHVGDGAWDYGVQTVISMVNVTLLLAILYIYVGIYREIKSIITIGQMLVMLAFLAFAITSNPVVQLAFGFRAEGLGPFAMIPDMFAAIALAILLEMSLE